MEKERGDAPVNFFRFDAKEDVGRHRVTVKSRNKQIEL